MLDISNECRGLFLVLSVPLPRTLCRLTLHRLVTTVSPHSEERNAIARRPMSVVVCG